MFDDYGIDEAEELVELFDQARMEIADERPQLQLAIAPKSALMNGGGQWNS